MEEQTTTTTTGGKNKFVLYATIAIVILLALGAGYFFMLSGSNPQAGDMSAEDLDEAVAIVNGEEIPRRAYRNAIAQLSNVAQAQGATLSEEQIQDQALESLINNRLLVQYAIENGAKATDAEVQAEYDMVVEQAGGADSFNEQLASLGISENVVRKELSEQLSVNKLLLSSTSAVASSTVSDEEVTAFYENATAAASGQEVPPLEDVRTQIEDQIRFQKQQRLVSEMVESLRAEATIEVLI